MSHISDFCALQNSFNDKMDACILSLQADVKSLDDQITALQDSSGSISPSDQELLDNLQTRSKNVLDKLNALDALTPPVPPKA